MELRDYVVFTDSKSVCMMLEDAAEENAGPAIIAEILHIAHQYGTAIQWIPSHVAIQGNEVADGLAKLGISDEAPT